MTTIPTAGLLRSALTLDAAMSGASGVALVAAAGPIAQATALPAPLLLACGLFFLPYAALLAWCATRDRLPRWLVWVLAGGNALWALDCAALPLLGLVSPNGWGIAFLAVQAVAVAAFAQMYLSALRRAPRARPDAQKRGISSPPSTGKECPVENGMAPAARVAMARPISSASPQRRIGVRPPSICAA